jgi:hypothetical protein
MEYIRFVEATMHSRFDRSRSKADSFLEKWGFGFVVLPVLLAIAMIVLSVFQPKNTNWVAESVQAEFGGKSANLANAPTEAVKPETQTPDLRTSDLQR